VGSELLPYEGTLVEAFSLIENTRELESVVGRLRDLLGVDHIVYYSYKAGVAPPALPFIRLTYPASWVQRYLQMGYGEVDPIVREGFRRVLPFDWREIEASGVEASFLADAAEHGIGPHGLSIPVFSKHGHRGLFSVSFSRPEQEWNDFLAENRLALIEIANRIHREVIVEVFGENLPHLTMRELECLRWIAVGKDTSEIAIILNISPHTVRDYMKSVRYKLDCVTSAQAVSKAEKLGLLTS
jgi:LuxR family transcriptional regulator, quorum-sensing system regulator CinR